jgi:hypothetical protein
MPRTTEEGVPVVARNPPELETDIVLHDGSTLHARPVRVADRRAGDAIRLDADARLHGSGRVLFPDASPSPSRDAGRQHHSRRPTMPAKLAAEPPRGTTLDRVADLTEDAAFVVLLMSGVVAAVAIIALALAL